MARIDQVIYTGKTRTTGGRDGAARSSDGRLDVKLAGPGSPREGTNPEQLLAAGWSACFIGAMGRAAREHKLTLPPDTEVNAEIDLGTGEGGFALQARLNISLPGVERGAAQAIIDGAHQLCPYSKLSRGNIDVTLTLV